MIYIFDIDGTLTPSRNLIDSKFKKFFEEFIRNNRVWLISGSDKDKTIEQLTYGIWSGVERAYQCAGNQLYIKGELVKENKFQLPHLLNVYLQSLLQESRYAHRYGNHIEERPGMVNFSVVGRNCTQEQRDQYYIWDLRHKEREQFANSIKLNFPAIDAVVGGEISIDIYPKGLDKGQILNDIDGYFSFFGDKLEPGGNDYPIKKAAQDMEVQGATFYHVKSWKDTRDLLYSIMTEGIT